MSIEWKGGIFEDCDANRWIRERGLAVTDSCFFCFLIRRRRLVSYTLPCICGLFCDFLGAGEHFGCRLLCRYLHAALGILVRLRLDYEWSCGMDHDSNDTVYIAFVYSIVLCCDNHGLHVSSLPT